MQPTWVTGVAVRELLLQLPARERDLVRIDDDDEVTGVDVRREDRLVLAAQQGGRVAGQAAEDDVRRVNDVLLTLDVAGLGAECAHGGKPSLWWDLIWFRAREAQHARLQSRVRESDASAAA